MGVAATILEKVRYRMRKIEVNLGISGISTEQKDIILCLSDHRQLFHPRNQTLLFLNLNMWVGA